VQRSLACTAVGATPRDEHRAAAPKAREPLDRLGTRLVDVHLAADEGQDWGRSGHDELVETEDGELEDELCEEDPEDPLEPPVLPLESPEDPVEPAELPVEPPATEPDELVEPVLDVPEELLAVEVEAAFRAAELTSAGSLPVTSWTRIPAVVVRKIASAIAMILRRSSDIRRLCARSRSAARARLSGGCVQEAQRAVGLEEHVWRHQRESSSSLEASSASVAIRLEPPKTNL